MVDFGAFIALDDGLEGLNALSDMGDGTQGAVQLRQEGRTASNCGSAARPESRAWGFTQRWRGNPKEGEAPSPSAPART